MEAASNPEGDESVQQQNSSDPKNIEILLQPTLPDLNELSRRKSPRTPKPSAKVHESTDRSVQSMFGLTTIIFRDKPKVMFARVVCYVEHYI